MTSILNYIAGFNRFQEKYFSNEAALYDRLSRGQTPKALVIACCDSRADPAIVTDSDPGELFVIRNVANLVPPYEADLGIHGVSSALEFGVKSLNVEHIIVLGHALCGGIKALMQGEIAAGQSEFIGPWMRIAARARADVMNQLAGEPFEVQVQACEQAAILTSLQNLLTFPWIEERVVEGHLQLHGWYFDLVRGGLWGYSAAAGRFMPLVESAIMGPRMTPFAPLL